MPSSMRRYRFFLGALALAAVVAGLALASFERRLRGFERLGFSAERLNGVFQVTGVEDVATGLQVGDLIYEVRSDQPASWAELHGLLRSEQESEVSVLRGEEVVTVAYHRPPLDIDFGYLILVAISLLYLAIGLYTALRGSHLPSRLFFFFCLTSAALYALSPELPPRDVLDRVVFVVDQVARTLLPTLTLHLFLAFPWGQRQSERRRFGIPLLYLPTAVLLTMHADLAFFDGRFVAGPATTAKLVLLDRLELFLLVGFSLLAVLGLLLRLGRQRSWEPRRQAQWLICGMLGGYAPFLLLYVVPSSFGWTLSGWLEAASVLPLALVPLSFAYAILKYRLWDLGVILRDSIAYTLTAFIGLFGFLLINVAVQRGMPEELDLLRNLLTFASGLAIAGVLIPTKGLISSGLERLHYRATLGPRRSLAQLGQRLLFERDLDRLCGTLLDGLVEGLDVTRATLYLNEGGGLVPVRAEERPRHLRFDAWGEDFWELDFTTFAALVLPAASRSPLQRLFAQGYRYAFPLMVRRNRVGVALVGHKHEGAPLNSEDVDLARGLLNQAALAIENARLLDEVHRHLQVVVELQEHNKGIIESSPAGIAVLDDAGRIQSANHAFAAIAGVDRPRLLEQELQSVLPVFPLPSPEEGLVEVSYCSLSGDEHHLQLSVAVYRRDADRQLRVLVVQDVSERILMEGALKEKERLASLGLLAAGVAHEVNTPLTGISSYAQLLMAETDRDSPQYEILRKMERQTFRASQIVNNLLEFARNRRDELHPVNLDALTEECIQTLRERAAEAGVTITSSCQERPLTVLGCEGELHQVLTNLVVNAFDAMAPGGGGHLSIALDRVGSRVRCRVSDTGPGIPDERLERVFEPFFSSKIGHGGTGLGLSITHNIVRRHAGEIRVENNGSSPGCTFTVEIPAQRGA